MLKSPAKCMNERRESGLAIGGGEDMGAVVCEKFVRLGTLKGGRWVEFGAGIGGDEGVGW